MRLGVVYADSLRLTILTELYMREMSPQEFFDAVGGSSLDSVRKHFLVLEEWGWLRRVRKRLNRRGRPAWVYRTTELALIDEDTWGEIPLSIRDAFSLQLTQQLSERLGLSLGAGMIGRKDQVFSLRALTVDEADWTYCLNLLMDAMLILEQEQTDAKVRLAEDGGDPVLMVVPLAGFQVDTGATSPRATALPPSPLPLDTRIPWTIRLAKVFGDPMNLAIMQELNARAMSPTDLQAKIGGASTQAFDRRCKLLTGLGWATQLAAGSVDPTSRKIYYRAISPAVPINQAWAIIPPSLRVGRSWITYRKFCQLVFEAVRSGTFNARTDRHLTWHLLLLDDSGCQQVTKVLHDLDCAISDRIRTARPQVAAKKSHRQFATFVGAFRSPVLKGVPLWGDLGQR